ncbi:MAG: hypothetical protein V7707_05590 [Motiliproteus sp.]
MITLLRFLGSISLACAAGLLLAMAIGLWPALTDRPGFTFILLLQAATSAAILVATGLKQQQNPLAQKALPSSLVGYGLFILMAVRWWQGS